MCFIVVFIAYFGIYRNVYKHQLNIKLLRIALSKKVKKNFRYTKKIVLIALTFFVMYLPLGMHSLVITIQPEVLADCSCFFTLRNCFIWQTVL